MHTLILLLPTLLLLHLPKTHTLTETTNTEMTTYLNPNNTNAATPLALRYAPLFFFSKLFDHLPCLPTWAFSGTPDKPDIYDADHKTPPAPQCEYPDVGCGCRTPGAEVGSAVEPFPVYYTVKRCSEGEVRVAYNLFYEKDGADAVGIETGHEYDWERIIIVHTQNPDNNNNNNKNHHHKNHKNHHPHKTPQTWTPKKLLLSSHSGYITLDWNDIKNTLTTEQIKAGAARDPDGQKNEDHPKVYVSWSKHANYDDQETAFIDPAAQSTGAAYRGSDWWYFVDGGYYILADNSTVAGKALGGADWGSADSNPPKVQEGICTAEQ